jgi:hypothetical protein
VIIATKKKVFGNKDTSFSVFPDAKVLAMARTDTFPSTVVVSNRRFQLETESTFFKSAKHSILLDPFISYEDNKVLSTGSMALGPN